MPPRGRQKPFFGQWNPVRALTVPSVGFETQLVWLILFNVVPLIGFTEPVSRFRIT